MAAYACFRFLDLPPELRSRLYHFAVEELLTGKKILFVPRWENSNETGESIIAYRPPPEFFQNRTAQFTYMALKATSRQLRLEMPCSWWNLVLSLSTKAN